MRIKLALSKVENTKLTMTNEKWIYPGDHFCFSDGRLVRYSSTSCEAEEINLEWIEKLLPDAWEVSKEGFGKYSEKVGEIIEVFANNRRLKSVCLVERGTGEFFTYMECGTHTPSKKVRGQWMITSRYPSL